MKRGEIYRVTKPPGGDPRRHRYFVIVSRETLIESRFSTVICAPIYTSHEGLSTQVSVGMDEGLHHNSSIHCDALVSIPKSMIIHCTGQLSPIKLQELRIALFAALALGED